MWTVFLCYTSQKAEVNQKEPVPCLRKALSQNVCSLIPRKEYCISLLVASQKFQRHCYAVLGLLKAGKLLLDHTSLLGSGFAKFCACVQPSAPK